jgi:hypothetical protein
MLPGKDVCPLFLVFDLELIDIVWFHLLNKAKDERRPQDKLFTYQITKK